MKAETPEERVRRLNMERRCKEIGRILASSIEEAAPAGEKWGFCLLMFDFGEGGSLAYMSNGQRDDVLKMLDEFRSKIADGQ